jgi:hypothetical protein
VNNSIKVDGQKFSRINMGLQTMILPQWAALHKLPMAPPFNKSALYNDKVTNSTIDEKICVIAPTADFLINC